MIDEIKPRMVGGEACAHGYTRVEDEDGNCVICKTRAALDASQAECERLRLEVLKKAVPSVERVCEICSQQSCDDAAKYKDELFAVEEQLAASEAECERLKSMHYYVACVTDDCPEDVCKEFERNADSSEDERDTLRAENERLLERVDWFEGGGEQDRLVQHHMDRAETAESRVTELEAVVEGVSAIIMAQVCHCKIPQKIRALLAHDKETK